MGEFKILIGIIFIVVFWTPALVLFIQLFTFQKKATIVLGQVINIEPVYRSVRYTFLIDYMGQKREITIGANNNLQRFLMGDTVELYYNPDDPKRVCRVKEYLYTLPVVLFLVSGIFAFAYIASGLQ